MSETQEAGVHGRLFRKLLALDWCLKKYQMQDKEQAAKSRQDACFDGTLERGQGRVISLLQMKEEIPTRDLGLILGIRQQSLNEQLLKLESRGYVERLPSEEDHRIMVVHLTKAGRALKIRRTDPEPIFSCLTKEEEAGLEHTLDKLLVQAAQVVEDITDSDFAARAKRLEELLGREKFQAFIEERLGVFPEDILCEPRQEQSASKKNPQQKYQEEGNHADHPKTHEIHRTV